MNEIIIFVQSNIEKKVTVKENYKLCHCVIGWRLDELQLETKLFLFYFSEIKMSVAGIGAGGSIVPQISNVNCKR